MARPRNPTGDLFARSQERVWTVSELTGRLRRLLESEFGWVRVSGEISGLKRAGSGHVYFQLKDESAALDAVLFRAAAARQPGGLPLDGEQVECLGRLTLYAPRGRTQLVVEQVAPRGAGELALRFERLKQRLAGEGLFAPERKRPLPWLPACIGLVTSPSGAAVRDVLQVLERRFPALPVLIAPVRVQGQGAAAEIAAAIGWLAGSGRVDVLIACRGGGSLEDLWAFNEEAVVRAIAAAAVPVISAVGHETDVVLADLAADVRAPTPSAAAELVVPDRAALRDRLADQVRALQRLAGHRLERDRHRLAAAARRMRDPRLVLAAHRLRLDEAARRLADALGARSRHQRRRLVELRVRLAANEPRSRLRAGRQRLVGLRRRLDAAARDSVRRRRQQLEARGQALAGLSPLAVLGRGYSLVTGPDGRLLRDAGRLRPGDALGVRPARGRLRARVQQVGRSDDKNS